MPEDIRSRTFEDLETVFQEWKEPRYRLTQMLQWLYRHRATDWEEMTNLPKRLRSRLAEQFDLYSLSLVRLQGSRDTTRKFLWRLQDGALIESVLIPASPALYGEASDRHTLCVSTQVGCAYGCRFCASGLDGWKRNLTPAEIVEQVLAVERWHAAGETRPCRSSAFAPEESAGRQHAVPPMPHRDSISITKPKSALINNLVIMGMGEPLANYENLMTALKILNAPWGGNIGARKITVSTSGLAPQIERLAAEPFQFRLALSLHGATDAVRDRIMPINRKYPLKRLVAACEFYCRQKGGNISFEYILIEGVNDALEHTIPLAELAHRLNAKVNLIPYNHVEGLAWKRPSEKTQEAFLAALKNRGIKVTLRREKGHDIDAACGQLRLRVEKNSNAE